MNRSHTEKIGTVGLVLALLLVLVACGPKEASTDDTGGNTTDTSSAVPTVANTDTVTYQGIDVSHYQGDIDWRAVKAAGITFVFAKATEGVSEVDPKFAANWAGINEAGLVRGAYHFFDPDVDARMQAQHFIATVTLGAGDLPPVIDIEVGEGVSTEGIDEDGKVWLAAVAVAYGVQPILYSDLSFIRDNLASGFSTYPLWLADYTTTPPEAPSDWTKWTFWQYSQSGQVDGVDGEVDQDRYQGTIAEWEHLLVPAAE